MPEGDTIYRAADVLRRALLDQVVIAARGRPGGAQLGRIVDARVAAVRTLGKHLLVDVDAGLTLHSHLGMNGSWHRYRPRGRWRADPSRAVAVIETRTAVAVCFDAPVIELIETRALPLHPVLARIGPDLLAEPPEIDAATARLRAAPYARLPLGEALLAQGAVSGLGNVYRSEILFIEGLDPFAQAGSVATERLRSVLQTGADLLRRNLRGGERLTMPGFVGPDGDAPRPYRRDASRWVYRRAGRPCRRCGSLIRSAPLGDPPRRLYWCPTCQTPAPPT